MISLGLCGLFGTESIEFLPGVKRGFNHDSAAVIVDDSGVVVAIEEERLSRVKHTNLFPTRAVLACLEFASLTLADLDEIAYFWDESWIDFGLSLKSIADPTFDPAPVRTIIAERLFEATGERVDANKIVFRSHHEAHAKAAFDHSGFSDSLVIVADGNGEKDSMSIYTATENGLHLEKTFPTEQSLGHYYTAGTKMVGYELFDEYKVMGLAPYGDPSVFGETFSRTFDLLPDGEFALSGARLQREFLRTGFRNRRAGEPRTQIHADFAAALQESLETVMMHVLSHWSRMGYRSLCFSGGVAHNSTLNGQILRTELFSELFVHPASHDAGAALGAALLSFRSSPVRKIVDVFWGLPMDPASKIEQALCKWSESVRWSVVEDPAAVAAVRLAEGAVVGWATGRSEFGPRALGARSIIADPRPHANKQRVNQIVKNREGYRPFAPIALADDALAWFEIPRTSCELRFMAATVHVQPERNGRIDAVTHVDGSARLQIVSDVGHPLERVLVEFKKLTGMGILLNTSFNSNFEPIVDSFDDCLRTFLTTGLDVLIVDQILIEKTDVKPSILGSQILLNPLVEMVSKLSAKNKRTFAIGYRDSPLRMLEIGEDVFDMVANGPDYRVPAGVASSTLHSLHELWVRRFIELRK